MPDPIPAAGYRLFSWLRQGLLAGVVNTTGGAPGPLALPIRLRLNDAREIDVPIHFYGPGHITGLDARAVIRTEPQPFATDFEPNYFPLLEFDRPDFPWLFTPTAPDGDRRLRPWLCLVVVRQASATLAAGVDQSLPVLECPRRELPNLAESWAWAHAQIVADVAAPLDHDALKQVLNGNPERTLSRLLCPRRLDPGAAYYACLVPTYEVGRKAGLGEPVTPAEEHALNPAWSSDPDAGAAERVRLPVYFQWEFSTGLAGDFEALARRLTPQPPPPTVGLRPMAVSDPGWGMPRLQPDAPGAVVDLGGALRLPTTNPRPWPDEARTAFEQALRNIINPPAAPDTSSGEPAVLAPPLYGQWCAGRQTVPAAGPPHWFRELNLDPRHRVAAGLGTLVIRYEQEQLMASAWEQLAQQEQDNQRLQRAQLAATVGEALIDKHLHALQPEQFLRVTGPVQGTLERSRAGAAFSARTAPAMAGQPALSPAFRRLTRAGGPVARRLERLGAAEVGAGAAARGGLNAIGTATFYAPGARAQEQLPAAAALAAQAMKTLLLAQLDPTATVLAAVQQQAPAAVSTDPIRFAPEFPQPMYEPLRDYFQGMLLPGLDQVPPNTIALLETEQKFIEAYLVGLNHEMSRELLWRGYPTDRRGTYFRRFWDTRGGLSPSTPADITAIADWADDSHLGEHADYGGAKGRMVLLLRGDLLRRYPRAIIYAVEAVWSDDGTRRELGATEQYPLFRATQAPDVTLLGFPLTEQQVRGADDPTDDGHPGWFFVLQEQPTEPRFGLDVAVDYGGAPQHWRDLSWGHLAPAEAALRQIAYVAIDGLLQNVTLDNIPWGRNSAQMAAITRQRPFRVAIHARTWLSGPP